MCYVGGPRCFKEASKTLEKAMQELEANPTSTDAAKQFFDARLEVDTTRKGNAILEAEIGQIDEALKNKKLSQEDRKLLESERHHLTSRKEKGSQRFEMLRLKRKIASTPPKPTPRTRSASTKPEDSYPAPTPLTTEEWVNKAKSEGYLLVSKSPKLTSLAREDGMMMSIATDNNGFNVSFTKNGHTQEINPDDQTPAITIHYADGKIKSRIWVDKEKNRFTQLYSDIDGKILLEEHENKNFQYYSPTPDAPSRRIYVRNLEGTPTVEEEHWMLNGAHHNLNGPAMNIYIPGTTQLLEQSHYKEGRKYDPNPNTPATRQWHPNGQISREESYSNGFNIKTWDTNGKRQM